VSGRLIGRHRGERPGPLLLCTAGLHGNEPSGVTALQRVFARLRDEAPPFAGDLVGFAGNLAALDRGRRYVDTDLNRLWRADRIASARAACTCAEDAELVALHDALHRAASERRGPVHLLDLHTTSAPSPPFGLAGAAAAHRAFAAAFGVPVVTGLFEHIDGVLADYAARQPWISMDFEGGPHDDPASVDHHEAAIWIALAAAGNLGGAPDLDPHRRRLADATRGIPRGLAIVDRHPVAPDDGFAMLPGFSNFHPVRAGEVVARDARGAVRVAADGRLFMPLYQGQGDDGFFLARPLGT
jgi:succinylglutamate desuccinylase